MKKHKLSARSFLPKAVRELLPAVEEHMKSQRLVHEFKVDSTQLIKIHIQTYEGQRFVDMRKWWSGRAGEAGAEEFTPHGLTTRVELLPELIRGLEKAQYLVTCQKENYGGEKDDGKTKTD